ncbi:MAG: hypothetical protein K8R21_02575 [Leptospira sp.]|nr:hypothetical protein [Leptospira sp.]
MNLRISKNSIPEDYRVGRWGISSSALKGVSDSRLFSSSSIPPGIEKSPDVWIYNDAGFSGTDAPGTSAGMGEEVRGILKSWGYIHE